MESPEAEGRGRRCGAVGTGLLLKYGILSICGHEPRLFGFIDRNTERRFNMSSGAAVKMSLRGIEGWYLNVTKSGRLVTPCLYLMRRTPVS